MKLYHTVEGIFIEHDQQLYRSPFQDWDVIFAHEEIFSFLEAQIKGKRLAIVSYDINELKLIAPIGSQEIWAAGVTYLRSKVARMEESQESGGATFYDKVYDADRPELFYKGNAIRTAGPGEQVRIRKDSTWNVPEPELTLVVNSSSKIIGYTIGNDMSSRSIEGENPLYLPQAKVYDRSAAIGPCILLAEEPLSPATQIAITISRNEREMYNASTTIDQMKRRHSELTSWLFRECSFPNGVYLMTGTCLVPGNDFTLQSGDHIAITIDSIGTLINTVA